MRHLKHLIVPLILFFVSLYIIFPFINPHYIPAAGENPFGMNPYFLNAFYIWQDKVNLGGTFIAQHTIYLYYVLWNIFKLFSAMIHPSITFIFLGFFLPGLFFYLLLKNLFKIKNELWYLPPALLYSYNVYRLLIGSVEQTMLFISLPLFFLFYYKFSETAKFKYIIILTLLANLSNAMSFNLAIFFIPYILLFSYFCFSVIYKIAKKLPLKKYLIYNVILLLFIVVSSLFWFVPMMSLMFVSYSTINKGIVPSMWNALGAGTFFDHFRYLGFWAFRAGYGIDLYYYPISLNYYKPFLVFSTFFVSIFSYVYLLFIKSQFPKRKLIIYLLTLTIFSFLLVAGIKSMIFGSIYNFLYDQLVFVKIYREPYAKFMPLYIFATSIGLFLSIYFIFGRLKNKYLNYTLLTILCLFIALNSYQFFNHNFLPFKPLNLYSKSSITKIPYYWENLNKYFNKKELDDKIFITQRNSYSNSVYNWEYGLNVSSDIAFALLDKKLIKDTYNNQVGVFSNIFNNKEVNLQKYLGFLGTRYVLQENDLEWRLAGINIDSPSKTDSIIIASNFNKVAGFGTLNMDYLNKIWIKAENETFNKEFYDELLGRSALTVYKAKDDYFLPEFYTPLNMLFIPPNSKLVPKIISQDDTPIRTVIYFKSQSPEIIESMVNLNSDKDLPILEFKKINPTKYKIIIHKASISFPLVFNETFSEGWKLYLTKIQKSNIKDISLNNYNVSKENEENQASKEEVKTFIDKGFISSLYNNTNKNQAIGFVSKNYQGTIQNNNLVGGDMWKTWFMKPLNEENHLLANGFSNSWIIDPYGLCSERTESDCLNNSDGTVDMELIAEFLPQRFLFLGLGINVLVMFFCIIYLLIAQALSMRLTKVSRND